MDWVTARWMPISLPMTDIEKCRCSTWGKNLLPALTAGNMKDVDVRISKRDPWARESVPIRGKLTILAPPTMSRLAVRLAASVTSNKLVQGREESELVRREHST